jgi:hypothetical protein
LKEEGNMAFYAVDVRNGVIQRVTEDYNGADNECLFLIEAASAKQARAKAGTMPESKDEAVCSSCRHCHCCVCEEYSAAKQYSDYWICHCCGALTSRVQSLHFKGGV